MFEGQTTPQKNSPLPKNFASSLIDLETKVESENIQMEDVLKLLDLYRIAIECFEAQENQIQLIFQSKTKQLLARPQIIECIAKHQKKIPSKTVDNRATKFKTNLEEAGSLITRNQVLHLIQEEATYYEELSKYFDSQLESQQMQLNERLQQRKNNSQMKRSSEQTIWESIQMPENLLTEDIIID